MNLNDVTGICVVHNSKELIQRAYESVRKFHPEMMIIIIDGSDPNDPCRKYVESLASDKTIVGLSPYNIGHGRGMNTGIRMCETRFALIFDSDIIMIKSPVQQMLDMMENDTYGVGYLEKTAYDGFEYGAKPEHKGKPFMMMLHPFFHLLQIKNYYKFHPYTHHGAPCYKAALDIHRHGLINKIIKVFPGIHHTSGKGWNWTGKPSEWIQHDTAGTRNLRRAKGQPEIDQGWDREPLPKL
jgi:glycosyltransferase involved in cell wall biosynthesis